MKESAVYEYSLKCSSGGEHYADIVNKILCYQDILHIICRGIAVQLCSEL